MAASAAPALLTLAIRGTQGVQLLHGPPQAGTPVPGFPAESSNACRSMGFSKDGSLFAWTNSTGVTIVPVGSNQAQPVCVLPRPNTLSVLFSPRNTFVALWERYFTRVEGQEGEPNLTIWSIANGEMLASFIAKSIDNWQPQWSDDESLFARNVTNEVQFYEGRNFGTIAQRLRVPGLAGFALSPGQAPYRLTIYVPAIKGSAAYVRMFQYPMFEGPNTCLANKSFFRSDKVNMSWNSTGTAVLVSTVTDVDKNDKSYYGETNLYFISAKGDYDCNVPLAKEGPIYDVTWSPNGREFVVVYGFMPAKATLYDYRCEPIFDFGTGPRNTVRFSPQGHILCIAGFGNLRGYMEMWDRKNLKMVCKPQAADSTSFEWMPDGEHILTATTAPRLRVGNQFKITHYTGTLVLQQDFQELWEVKARPFSPNPFPAKAVVAPLPASDSASTSAPPKAAYIPPHLRGKVNAQPAFKLHDEDEAPKDLSKPASEAVDASKLSKAALKNKKKRESKAKNKAGDGAEDDEETAAEATAAPAPAPAPEVAAAPVAAAAAPVSTSDLSETEKKIRNLVKKLRAVEDLKAAQAAGKKLELNQLEKLGTEAALRAEIAALEKKK